VPKNTPEVEAKKMVYEALCKLGQQLIDLHLIRDVQKFDSKGNVDPTIAQGAVEVVRPRIWLIDRGYFPDVVHRFCQTFKAPFQVFPVLGTSSTKYMVRQSTLIGEPHEECHVTETKLGQYLVINACYWRETAQKAWLAETGAPGGLSLYGDKGLVHKELALQVCAEKLVDKAIGERGSKIYRWATQGGQWHDWGDSIYLAFAGAAALGLRTSGLVIPEKKKGKPRRRIMRNIDL
jgi:hypothetical protein